MMGRTTEEKNLLEKMKSGVFDGRVGNDLTTSGGSTVWTTIENGEPTRYKQGPGGKVFDGKENVRYDGKLHTLETFSTDDEKLGFFQKFGWLMDDDDAKKYSANFKPK
jgi:hypothetical protein